MINLWDFKLERGKDYRMRWLECPGCKHRINFTERPPLTCPACGCMTVIRGKEQGYYEICELRGTYGLSCKNCTYYGSKSCPLNWQPPLPSEVKSYIKRRVKRYDQRQHH